ncbi:MAG: FAD-dependent oxidoreductase, partial [Gemmatimonadota bacterium]|nr:FAD-dependent oxidoreductase [Gemmatimonadota bacterium]
CTRTKLAGAIPIRRIKRFVADRHYAAHDRPGIDVAEPNGKRVAIVGSGPAGLTAAWQLARNGYGVKIFEAAPRPGGALRLSIPGYRLPIEVVERDIANVTAIGVEIETGTRVTDLAALRAGGFDAVVVATGTPKSARLGVPGEDLDGVSSALAFLRSVKLEGHVNFAGRDVVVVGGGNVAIDAARTARRLGASAVHLVCLERRSEMPAHAWEVDEALAEGVVLHDGWGIARFRGGKRVDAVELKRCTRVLDAEGRFDPRYDERETMALACGAAIVAVGMSPDTDAFASQVPVARNRRVQVHPRTLQSEVPYVFAAGDVATGPTDITRAVGQGRRAAFMVDRWLRGLALGDFEGFDDRLGTIEQDTVIARQKSYGRREPVTVERRLVAAPSDFAEVEPPLTEAQAAAGAGSCLDCGVCSECGECVAACPADAIDLNMHERTVKVDVGAVVLSTGFKLFAADVKPEYGWGKFANVITGTQMDRLLAPTRPYNTVLRPGDGKVPERIAYISCTGSRDKTVGNPLCSKFCCMYSVKQNQLIMGALPLADVTMHYMDMRAAGKRYEEFYQQAKDMGATYIKGRVAEITEKPDGNLVVHYEDVENGGRLAEAEYDLVVLAVGIQPNHDVERLFMGEPLRLDEFAYVAEADDDLDPGRTSLDGVFVAGTASGAKDIVDSITHAGAAVAQVAAHLQRAEYAHQTARAVMEAAS